MWCAWQEIDGLLLDDLCQDIETLEESRSSQDVAMVDRELMTLYDYMREHFTGVNSGSAGALMVLESQELRVKYQESRMLPWDAQHQMSRVDKERIYRILENAEPTIPSSKTAILCNLTKGQFICTQALHCVRPWDSSSSGMDECSNESDWGGQSSPSSDGVSIGIALFFDGVRRQLELRPAAIRRRIRHCI